MHLVSVYQTSTLHTLMCLPNSTKNSMAAPRLMRPSTVRILAIVEHADEATSLADHKNHPRPIGTGRLVLGVAGVVVITIAAIRREQLA